MNMNKAAGIAVIVLVSIQMAVALLLVGVANFADGGTWWERGFLSVLHPLAVALLLAALLLRRQGPSLLSRMATGIVGLYIAGAVGIAIAILAGLSKGDWSLSLILALIPAAGLVYLLSACAGEPEAVVPE